MESAGTRYRLERGVKLAVAAVGSQGRRNTIPAAAWAQHGTWHAGSAGYMFVCLLWKEVMGNRTPRRLTWPSFALAEDRQGKMRAEGSWGSRSERKGFDSKGFGRP